MILSEKASIASIFILVSQRFMDKHNRPNPYDAWQRWLSSPSGVGLTRLTQGWLDDRLADQFGYHALEIGPGGIQALAENRISSRTRLSFYAPTAGLGGSGSNELVCAPEALPIESDSVDLVVLLYALELADDPHALLREVERVLIPEGQLMVVGLNPHSLWALHRPLSPVHFPPVRGTWLSYRRLRDWCQLLGLEVNQGAFGLYRPVCQSSALWDRLAWMEQAGARWWPALGGVYWLGAAKRRTGMRLIRADWGARRARGARATAVTSAKVPSGLEA
jgi:SAM-dependent methyltransferase